MSARLAAAALAAMVGLVAQAASAWAADIYDGPTYGSRSGSAYDDPRYADIYGDDPPLQRHARPYQPPYAPAEPYVRRDRYGYLPPLPAPPRFDEHPRYTSHGAGPCVPRTEIRRGLIADGWGEFSDLELRDRVAVVTASRPNGQAYRLRVDRCTGEIVQARPLEHERGDNYAGRRRYDRYY